jgi:acetolactate synthase small subunit
MNHSLRACTPEALGNQYRVQKLVIIKEGLYMLDIILTNNKEVKNMSLVIHKWMDIVPQITHKVRKYIPSYEIRLKKAEANVARRMARVK